MKLWAELLRRVQSCIVALTCYSLSVLCFEQGGEIACSQPCFLEMRAQVKDCCCTIDIFLFQEQTFMVPFLAAVISLFWELSRAMHVISSFPWALLMTRCLVPVSTSHTATEESSQPVTTCQGRESVLKSSASASLCILLTKVSPRRELELCHCLEQDFTFLGWQISSPAYKGLPKRANIATLTPP